MKDVEGALAGPDDDLELRVLLAIRTVTVTRSLTESQNIVTSRPSLRRWASS